MAGYQGSSYGDYSNGSSVVVVTDQNEIEPSNKRPFAATDQADDRGPAKKSRQQEIEMRCLIPSKSAGALIGKGGHNIKDMRETFHSQIQIPDADARERLLRVFGSIQSCGEIILRVLPTIHENSGTFRKGNDQMSIKLLVHQSQAGGVIGTKGFKIKELREQTGATIKVEQDCLPGSTDRVVMVSGTPEIISSCIVLILEMLQEIPPKGAVQKYDPAMDGTFDDGYDDDWDRFGGGGRQPPRGGGFNMGRGGGFGRGGARGRGFGPPRGRFSPGGRGGFRGGAVGRGFGGPRGGRGFSRGRVSRGGRGHF